MAMKKAGKKLRQGKMMGSVKPPSEFVINKTTDKASINPSQMAYAGVAVPSHNFRPERHCLRFTSPMEMFYEETRTVAPGLRFGGGTLNMRQQNTLAIAVVAILIATCPNAPTDSQQRGHGPHRLFSGGSGTASVKNFANVASPHPKIIGPAALSERYRERIQELPSRRGSGARQLASDAVQVTPQPTHINPCNVASSPCAFDGVAEESDLNCTGCYPPDPNAAVGAGEIVEMVNSLMRVTDKSGAVLCGGNPAGMPQFLNTTDILTDPHIQFDNVNQRFSFVMTVEVPQNTSPTPAMWVAASATSDACGNWWAYRVTFEGPLYPNGTFLDYPILGQDTNALLISTRDFTPDAENFAVFGIPKSKIYAGANINFESFAVQSLTAPVVNAGQPMIASPVSFFLAAVPGTGYKLYRLTNSGGADAVLTETDIASSFQKPPLANQPNSTVTIDASDGNILNSPTFDGTFIWFAHTVDYQNRPTVRYGAVDTTHNTVATAYAFHSSTSDDFVASVGVSITPAGETLFLNWAFTDTGANPPIPESDVVIATPATQSLANLVGGGTVYASGGNLSTSENGARFGDFSSVSINPTVSDCALATHEYFASDGSWKTRMTPIGRCENTVIRP